MILRIDAHAKLNLTLHITGKRDDGYHTLDTIMQSVMLGDEIVLSSGEDGEIHLSCSDDTIDQEKNIAYKAAKLFLATLKENDGFVIHLHKNIPVSAGLGGGSADAAGVLFGLNHWYGNPFSHEQLCEMALTLGADVPFCLTGGTQLVKGIGEQMCVLPPCPDCGIVLLKPCQKGSTAEMYQKYDEIKGLPAVDNCAIIEGMRSGDIRQVAPYLVNSFTPLYDGQAVETALNHLVQAGALDAGLSGSGPTVFGLFDTLQHAHEAAWHLATRYAVCIATSPAKEGCRLIV